MCGIFGAVSTKNIFNSNDFEKFNHLSNLVAHRGPDAAGNLRIDSKNNQINQSSFDIYLGHRRLSIIDLSEDGNQPMHHDNLAISYNGEIFNYVELREELQKKGVRFKTKSDTEVILRLYSVYGESAFALLNGMWAFILVDLKERKVVVSRDRFSIKPLFYLEVENAIFFASEIKQLLPLLKSVSVNEKALFNFFQQNLVDIGDDTFFKSIKRIPPKNNFVIDLNSGRSKFTSYWDYIKEDIHQKDIYEQFRELFIDSIKIRLRSDVEVGSLLSGGLDSSAITVIANNLQNSNINSFSIISENKKISEEKFVDIVVQEKKISCSKLSVTHTEMLANLDKTIEAQDEPFPSFSMVAQYSILEKIKKESDIKVVLSGQGGDEILMGYLKYYFFYLQKLVKTNKFNLFIKEIFGSLLNRTALFQFKIDLAKRYIPFFNSKNADYLLINSSLEKIWKVDSLYERQIADIDQFSVPMLTRYEDRNSMAHSIETRLPMLDHRLVNFVLNAEPQFKIKNGWTKYMLRHSITEMPERIRWRNDKLGFVVPEADWLRGEFKDKIQSVFNSSRLGKMGIIDDRKFMEYYNKFLNKNYKIHPSDISKVFFAELWVRKYFWGE